jgi:hypothetical protein
MRIMDWSDFLVQTFKWPRRRNLTLQFDYTCHIIPHLLTAGQPNSKGTDQIVKM